MNSRTVDPVFEGIDISQLEKEPSARPSGWLLSLIGVLLLVLMVSWTLSDTVQGIVQSERVRDAVLDFSEARIVWKEGTLARVQEEFVQNQHREIKACLFGLIDGDGAYIIESVSFPEVIRANVVHVVSVPCPTDVLIDLHSHPVAQCLASEQDASVLRELQRQNPNVRMLVMCGQDRFALM
ncbi:hypothetical protein C4580_04425 [Candidatus Woesearchaeota archaeon]|nr:MAG: hypothetical protein C4580_04425 [Candidatus Woesearchaeota archaeon]